MKLTKTKDLETSKQEAWDILSDIHNWTDSLNNLEIIEKISDRKLAIKTKVNMGFFNLKMTGFLDYELLEMGKMNVSIIQKSNSVSMESDVKVELLDEGEKCKINLLADVKLSGPMAQVASNIAEKIFNKFFEKLCERFKK